MGNQLMKGYSLQGEPKSGIGAEKIWKLYQGQKHSTNTSASIFTIQKRTLNRSERDDIIAFAKKEAMGLARIRHPGVLAISETLIEDENILAFSTEPVLGNLTMLCREKKLREIISSETQLRLNLCPLLETIKFLHESVKTVHLSINFDNIYITKEGKWKISGLGNSQIYTCDQMELAGTYRCTDYAFSSPEIVMNNSFSVQSDSFSFGVLLVHLLGVLVEDSTPKVYKTKSEYQQSFQQDIMAKLNSKKFSLLSNFEELKTFIKSIINQNPSQRINVEQIRTSRWINDKMVLTVRHLENITNFDNKQQIQFLKGLLGILNDFKAKLLLRKIIPLLVDLLKFKHLIPSVIYISFEMLKEGKMISKEDFKEHIWPHLKKVTQGKEMTAHSIFLFVQSMALLEPIVTLEGISQVIIPLYIKCYDCPPKLKDLALRQTEFLISKMDYQFVKVKMIPKIITCLKDGNSDIHKKGLIALRKTLKILDPQTITSLVLPGLQSSRKSGSDPFINSITVSIYQMLGKTLPTEVLSSKLIPTILPYLTDPSVKEQDFYNYKNVLMVMMEKIENERKKYWKDSGMEVQPKFTEKDFEFEDEEAKEKGKEETGIGKGSYSFLQTYTKSVEPEQKKIEEPIQSYKQKSMENSEAFNFNDNFQYPKTEQPFEQEKVEQLGQARHQQPAMRQIQKPKQQYKKPVNYDQNLNNDDAWKQDYNQPIQNPIKNPVSPETQPKKNPIPKLRGPGMNTGPKSKVQQTKNNDPWSNLSTINPVAPNYPKFDIQKATVSEDPFNFTSMDQKKQEDWNYGNNQQKGFSSNAQSNPIGLNNNLGGGGTSSFFGNSGDDPFAQIQKEQTYSMDGYNPQGVKSSSMSIDSWGGQQSSQSANMNWNWSEEKKQEKEKKKDNFDFDLL